MGDILDRIKAQTDSTQDPSVSTSNLALEERTIQIKELWLDNLRDIESNYVCRVEDHERAHESRRELIFRLTLPVEFKKPLFGKEKVVTEYVLQIFSRVYLIGDPPEETGECAVTFELEDGHRRLDSSGKMSGEISSCSLQYPKKHFAKDDPVKYALDCTAYLLAAELKAYPGIRKRGK